MNSVNDRTLHTYLTVQSANQPSVIPNESAVTFITKKSGMPQVWKCDMASLEVKQFTDFPDRTLSVHHSPTGAQTIVGMDYEGNEKQQFYLLSEGDTKVEELVVSKEYFHEFGGWSTDGTKIAYSSNRRHPGYFDVYIFDLATKTEKKVYEIDGNCTPLCWTKDGGKLLLSIPETNIDQSLYVLDLDTKTINRLGSKKEHARYQSVELTADGKGGYLLTDSGLDTLGIVRFLFSEPSEMAFLFTAENWDVEEIKLSPEEDKLAFSINEGGVSRLGIFNIANHTHFYINSLPSGVYQSFSWSTNNELILSVKSAVLPGDIWKVSLEEDIAERLTYVGDVKGIEPLMEPELCSFSSFDGVEVPYFYYSKQSEFQPVVVYVHGGPESQIKAEYNPVIQFLAANGFAVVAPNVRGSMGYGRNYVKLDDKRKRLNAVADLKWLVKHLVDQKHADPDKVGIMGRSYGGFMVLAALTHYPDIWAAAVDIVGISHFRTFLENTGPWRRKLREAEYGSLQDHADFFEEIAPLNLTGNISAPLLVFHGRNDTRVPVMEAVQLTDDLKRQNKSVELTIFDDEGHQTEKLKNHIQMNSQTIKFFQKHLERR
ncbi:S9 family peptidase [Virgibacillus siamensis]|uniref:S9 family peptidase n=1 Tax=Virgibacillus siamensis TaxID=480071 RepID=UPI0011156018|nr:S9 family peptidase [Virgibacillus siamensis]